MYCLFYVVLCTVCVYMCAVLLPPGGYPIAVNKYIRIYHIKFEVPLEVSMEVPDINNLKTLN